MLLQMQALAATGAASAALQVARDYRHRLVEETGLDPSPALHAAEGAVAAGVRRRAGGGHEAESGRRRPCSAATRRWRRCTGCSRQIGWCPWSGPGVWVRPGSRLEVARRADRATVLLLAPVTDPAAVSFALAHAMGLTVSHGDVLAACAALLGRRSQALGRRQLRAPA